MNMLEMNALQVINMNNNGNDGGRNDTKKYKSSFIN